MVRYSKRANVVLCAIAVALCSECHAQSQQPSTSAASSATAQSDHSTPQAAPPAKASPALAQGQPTSPTDPAAQIDKVLKQCNELTYVKGNNNEAEQAAKQALELSKAAHDEKRKMRSLLALEAAYFYQTRYTEALTVGQQALDLAKQFGDTGYVAQALQNIAMDFRNLGRYEESLTCFYRSTALARELKDLPLQWALTRNIGVMYLEMGEEDKAEGLLREALRIVDETKAEQWKTQLPGFQIPSQKGARESSLNALANCESGQEHYTAAINYLERALADKPANPGLAAEILNNEAFALERIGESQKAVDRLQQAMKLWESAGNPPHPIMLAGLAVSEESLGHFEEALAGQRRALAIVHQHGGSAFYEGTIEWHLGHVERAMGKLPDALRDYQGAVRAIELIQPLSTESARAFSLAAKRTVYTETANLLYDLHRESEALEMAERGRARAFLDMLAESRAGLADELTPAQRDREATILARISRAQKDLWRKGISPAEKKESEAALAAAENELQDFHLQVRLSNPRYASLVYPEPASAARIQSALLDSHTALVEYLLGEKRSLVWVLTKDKITTSVLPPRKEIEEQVATYRRMLSERVSALTVDEALAQVNGSGAKLYRSIFRPIEPAIAAARTLIIVPDGTLDYLPLEALVTASSQRQSGGHPLSYLVQKFALVYGPSASALVTVQAMNREVEAPSKMLLAFGDPVMTPSSSRADAASISQVSALSLRTRGTLAAEDYVERGFSLVRLPYTREEVLGISKLFPVSQRQVYLGAEAREETVKAQKLDDFRYIHFASHGFLDEKMPGRSGILLSRAPQSAEDGVLQVEEIMRLKMNADLVTLSACSTGLGKFVNGEGILGLTRAFFYAGARNVAVSLWNVNDSATATLMESFYRNLNRGLPKSEAMRQAKLGLLTGSQTSWHYPYYWAPFIIEGEGR